MNARNMITASLLLLLVGCAEGPSTSATWISTSWKDDFTDVNCSMVTTGTYHLRGGAVMTTTGSLYPFVASNGGVLMVGVKSGGSIRMPVGDVQIRIDDNPAWTISKVETPLLSESSGKEEAAAPSGDSVTDAIAATQRLSATAMLPYTATSGKRAEQILAQMMAGHMIRFRSVSPGMPTSTTGEYPIDQSFRDALSRAGIAAPDIRTASD